MAPPDLWPDVWPGFRPDFWPGFGGGQQKPVIQCAVLLGPRKKLNNSETNQEQKHLKTHLVFVCFEGELSE